MVQSFAYFFYCHGGTIAGWNFNSGRIAERPVESTNCVDLFIGGGDGWHPGDLWYGIVFAIIQSESQAETIPASDDGVHFFHLTLSEQYSHCCVYDPIRERLGAEERTPRI